MRKQNVDHHSDAVVNKIIEKDVGKYSTKFSGDNINKSAEFIFDDSEEKIKAKNIRNYQVGKEYQRESEEISNNILERMEVSEIYIDNQSSEDDEENLEFNTSIFDILDEVSIQGYDN